MKKKIVAFIICIPFCLIGIYHTITVPVPIPPDMIIFQNVEITDEYVYINGQLFRSADVYSHFTSTEEDDELIITFYQKNLLRLVLFNEYGSCFIKFKLYGDFKNIQHVKVRYFDQTMELTEVR